MKGAASKARKFYPYSLIPGGVDTVGEIQDAVLRDPVVAAHYALVQVNSLQKVQLNESISRYVSFRVGTKVYWTSRKLSVAKGETVFLDKEGNGVRGRCGNQLSRLPMTPITEITRIEPTPQIFDTPVTPLLPMAPTATPIPTEIGNLLAPQNVPPPIATPTIPVESGTPPIYQPIYGFPGGPIGSSPPSGTVTPPGVVPPSTPEVPVIPSLPVQFGPIPTAPTYPVTIPTFGYQPIVPLTPTVPVLSPPTAPGTPGVPTTPLTGPPTTPTTPTVPSTPTMPTMPTTPTTPTTPTMPTTPTTPTTPTGPGTPETPPVVDTPEPLTLMMFGGGLGLMYLLRRKRA
jgi:hypothetical protein